MGDRAYRSSSSSQLLGHGQAEQPSPVAAHLVPRLLSRCRGTLGADCAKLHAVATTANSEGAPHHQVLDGDGYSTILDVAVIANPLAQTNKFFVL